MKTIFTVLLLLTGLNTTQAQLNLKPFIGVDSLPSDTDVICDIPWYLGDFEDSGLFEGDTVHDFQLFTPDGESFHLADELTFGKPVLLINGNYTCPVFRGKIAALNQIVAEYGNQVTVRVVYTLEAHPAIDISPYFGYVNTGTPNQNAGILYRQPVTYGERLDIIRDMLAETSIDAPILVDGPCNPWWATFGPAPNNAYLINSEGIVAAKHAWFNRTPEDMFCDIEQLFTPGTTCGGTGAGQGAFTFSFLTDTIAYGAPGDALYVEAELKNPTSNPVNIEIKRMIENIPDDWASSMCIDICYNTTTDYTTIQIPAGGEQLFIMDFFTGVNEGLGMVQIGFRNLDDENNRFVRRMWASTLLSSNADELSVNNLSGMIQPNPAHQQTQINLPESWFSAGKLQLRMYDLNGNTLLQNEVSQPFFTVERANLPAGVYLFQVLNADRLMGAGKICFE